MANNAQKTPVATAINHVAMGQAAAHVRQTGRGLPCSVVARKGAIVTVKFEIADAVYTLPQVTMPMANSLYGQEPIQVGDKGVAVPADAYLGGMSGLGGGVAALNMPGNLSALVWHPIGNASWAAPGDPSKHLIQGPTGVVLQDLSGECSLTLSPTGIIIKVGGTIYNFSTSGATATGADFIADTISLKTHHTSGVQAGGAISGLPVP